MIEHIVMWKLLPGKDKAEAYAAIAPALEGLVGVVPGLLAATVHSCYAGYDLCLCAQLTSKVALEGYQLHHAHLACKEIVHSFMGERAAADFER